MRRTAAALLLTVFSLAAVAQAPAGAPLRVRGTVQQLQGTALSVTTRGGEHLTVKLADNYTVTGVAKADVAEVRSGKYVGTTTVGERDGALVALEVHIYPEAMRGVAEGHRDWDLRPQSKMTNANVAEVVRLGEDRVLTVTYKGGEKKVLVPPDATIVKLTPTDRAALKAGCHVFAVAQRRPDGSLFAPRVYVGLEGQVPPM